MLSYVHGFHAGNLADVSKHVIFLEVLDYLCQKEGGLAIIDSHAGHALYDLHEGQALKTAEFRQGVLPVFQKQLIELQNYIHCLHAVNPNGELRFYPGTAALAALRLRRQDRLYLSELHPTEYRRLQDWHACLAQRRRVHIAQEDGLRTLSAKLPTPRRRAVLMIDPSYEMMNDYRDLPKYIHQALRRMPTAVVLLWYPIVERAWTEDMLARLPQERALRLEHVWAEDERAGMSGAGLWIWRAPWTLAQRARVLLTSINDLLSPNGTVRIDTVPEA